MAKNDGEDKEKQKEEETSQKTEETNEKPEFPPLEDVRNYTILPGRREGVNLDD